MMASADYRLRIVMAAEWFRRINDTIRILKDGSTQEYTANWHNFTFLSPTPTLPRWEREFMKGAYYASSQYICKYC